MKKFLVLLFLLMLMTCSIHCLSVGQADSFESPTVPNSCCQALSNYVSNATLWKGSSMSLVGLAKAGSAWSPPWGSPDGSQFLYLKGVPTSNTAYTNLTELVIDSYYTISFLYAIRNQYDANMNVWLNVTVDDGNIFTVNKKALMTWTSQTSVSFKATKSVQTLTFKFWSVNGNDHSVAIDLVSLNQLGTRPQYPNSFETPLLESGYLYFREDREKLKVNERLTCELCDNCGISSNVSSTVTQNLSTFPKFGSQFAFLQTNLTISTATLSTYLFNTSSTSYYTVYFYYAFSTTEKTSNVELNIKVNGNQVFTTKLSESQEWKEAYSIPFKVNSATALVTINVINSNSQNSNDFVFIDAVEIETVGLTTGQVLTFDEFDLSLKGYLPSSSLSLPSVKTPVSLSINSGLASNSYYPISGAEDGSTFVYFSTSYSLPVANMTFQSYGLIQTLEYTLSMKIATTLSNDPSYLTIYVDELAIYQSNLTSITSFSSIETIPFKLNQSIANFKIIINNVDGKNRLVLIDDISFDTYPKPTPLTDSIIFGNFTSENEHLFSGSLSLNGTNSTSEIPLAYSQNVTYRRIGPDSSVGNNAVPSIPNSFLNFTIGVHPNMVNYITIKMYGSDNDNGAIFIFWKPNVSPIKTSNYPGCYLLASDVLMLGQFNTADTMGFEMIDFVDWATGPAPRKFYYGTIALPLYMTANKTKITIMLGGFTNVAGYSSPALVDLSQALKPIYRVYSHVDPFFVPYYSPSNIIQSIDSKFDVITKEVDEISALPLMNSSYITPSQILANITALKTSYDSQMAYLMSRQAYGSQWNASLDIWNSSNPYAVPFELYGAPYLPYSNSPTSQLTRTQWLINGQYWSTNSNNNPMQMIGVFALVYKSNWSSYANNSELLDRVVAGVDYYTRQQGSNGAFLATSSSTPWCGAPNRNSGCGNALDGVGPYSLGLAIGSTIDELTNNGFLEQTVNLSLNANTTTRRDAWWNMLYKSASGILSRTRGGCGSQGSVYGGKKLYPNRTIISLDDLQFYIDQAIGFKDQARNPSYGPFFSENGISMECSGVKGGGMDFNYGTLVRNLLAHLSKMSIMLNMSNATIYQQRSLNTTIHQARYVYQEWVESTYPNSLSSTSLRKPTTLNTRIEHGPDEEEDNTHNCWYHGSISREPACLRFIYHFMLRNNWPTSYTSWSGVFAGLAFDGWNFIDYFIETANYIANNSNNLPDYVLPSELTFLNSDGKKILTPNKAYVEVTLNAVHIKNNMELLIININRKHTVGQVTGYAQVNQITPQTRRQTFVALNNTDGFDGLYVMQYGFYHIAVNRQAEASYSFYNMSISASKYLVGQVLDLVSGQVYNFNSESVRESFTLPPRSGIVLIPLQYNLSPITNFDMNYQCNSTSKNNSNVCSGRGQCIAPDTCQCLSGYQGDWCQISPIASQHRSSSPSTSTSQHTSPSTSLSSNNKVNSGPSIHSFEGMLIFTLLLAPFMYL